jgi:photosystem II stability/assembly factor-like uncharacterized protein
MSKMRLLNLVVRIGLFALILILGTIAALVVDETAGLALADLSNAPVQAMVTAEHGDILYANVTGDSQPSGIYRSDDSGNTWQMVSAGPSTLINTLAVHAENEAVLFAGTVGGPVATTNNLWRSDDGGRTWRKFFISLPADPHGSIPAVTALATDPHQPETLYVGTDGQGVYRFDVGADGQGYKMVGDVSLYDAHVKSLVVGPNSRVYALTNEGLFTIKDDTWQKLEAVPEVPVSLAVATSDPQVLYAGAPSSGVYRSTDGGQTWEPINDGLGMTPGAALRVTALTIDEQNPEHLVVATAYGLGSQLASGGIYESQNAGHTWTKLGEAEGIVRHLTLDQGAIYAATGNGLLRYGQLEEQTPGLLFPELRPLADPSGVQLLILLLTVVLAALALLGPTEWLLGRGQAKA